MQMIVDDPKEKPLATNNKYIDKFLELSEKTGNFIYSDKLSKQYVIDQIKTKKESLQKKTPVDKPQSKISDMLSNYVTSEKQYRKYIGMIIISTILLSIIALILYVISYIFSILLDIMEWWLLAIVFLGIVIPLFIAIAYYIAKGDY